jgi:LPXTG-motif cell wall-anchored protein
VPALAETVDPTAPPSLGKTGAPQVPLAIALSVLLLALGMILALRRRSHLEG